ncbi:hypothetical protein D3C83_261070 [compost metagenome]
MIGLDLRGNLADVAQLHAELVVSDAIPPVHLAYFLVAEGFQVLEGFFECHGCFPQVKIISSL